MPSGWARSTARVTQAITWRQVRVLLVQRGQQQEQLRALQRQGLQRVLGRVRHRRRVSRRPCRGCRRL